jgi:hypothetical protein
MTLALAFPGKPGGSKAAEKDVPTGNGKGTSKQINRYYFDRAKQSSRGVWVVDSTPWKDCQSIAERFKMLYRTERTSSHKF